MTSISYEREATRGDGSEPFRACFGVGCPRHSRCARYAAVVRSQASPKTIGTCLKGNIYPLFVAVSEPGSS
jgi:hypothetical protein